MEYENRIASLEQMAQDNHDFWHKPTVGGATRAERLDRLLAIAEHTKFTSKLLIWLLGAVMSIIGGWTVVQRFFEGLK